MKKIFLFSVISLLMFGGANATVCKLVSAKCYTTMGNGYFYDVTASDSWDITSNCWGKKYICAEALTNEYKSTHPNTLSEPVALGRKEIAVAVNANDFDVMTLNGDCFGTRFVKDGGAQIKFNGNYVNVWCSGVLDDMRDENITIIDTFDNGDITTTPPTCSQLSKYGYANIQNGKCYGKYYNQDDYRVICNGESPTLIVLNGALQYGDDDSDIKTKSDADARFNDMYINAQKLYKSYFNE